jgi:hypothetical protein
MATYETQTKEMTMTTEIETTVCGNQVQYDNSGVGHNWRNISRDDIPANIVEEIEGEMIDGGKDECDDFLASNGCRYRW